MTSTERPELDFSRDWSKTPRRAVEILAPHPELLAVYMVIKSRARRVAGEVITKTGLIHLDAGQAVYGRSELASACGMTEQNARTAISRLKRLGFLTTKSTSRGTVATVCGYKETSGQRPADQPADQPASQPTINQPPTSRQPATNQPLTTNQRIEVLDPKEGKEEGESPPSLDALRDPIRTHFDTRHREKLSAEHTWTAREEKHLRELVSKHTDDEIERAIDVMFCQPPEWPKGRDVQTLNEFFNKFVRAEPVYRKVRFLDDRPKTFTTTIRIGGVLTRITEDAQGNTISAERLEEPDDDPDLTYAGFGVGEPERPETRSPLMIGIDLEAAEESKRLAAVEDNAADADELVAAQAFAEGT